MSLKQVLDSLNQVLVENAEFIKNEESTKQFLILPFIKGLGFDVLNPREVTPEFTADFHKKSEKVDYAIHANNEPRIFIEAKSINARINRNIPQLSRYFSTFPSVKLGILSNGIEYQFFTDLKHTNIMDDTPFFTFDIRDYTVDDFKILYQFTKQVYNETSMKRLAESLCYFDSLKSIVDDVFECPSADFIQHLIKSGFKFNVSDAFVESMRPMIQKTIQDAIVHVFKSQGATGHTSKPTPQYAQPIQQKIEQSSATARVQTQRLHVTTGRSLNDVIRENETSDKKPAFTQAEIATLNKIDKYETIPIILPHKYAYRKLLNVDPSQYSVEKGNPNSDFFVASVVMQGTSTTYGYLIGQYLNNGDDVNLYDVKANEIAKFLAKNPTVKSMGFINARLNSRTTPSGDVTYFLKSVFHNLAFKDVPHLVTQAKMAMRFFN